ncbi:MAG TPA: phosphoglycerate dehydrogenase [Chloroflexota bacterium]|nr:phosphoglycerate dehydrogenase [Chloroflexota bacterium]
MVLKANTIAAPPHIIVADTIADDGIRALQEFGDVHVHPTISPDELLAIIPNCVALVVRSRTRVTREMIEAAKNLRVIGRAGIGTDNIDVEAASRHGIVVVNAPTAVAVAAAEHTIALILSLFRRIPQAHQSVIAGRWERNRFVGTELKGKTVGIIGLGNIGAEVARRLAAFDVRLIGSDPFVNAEYASRIGVELLPLEQLIGQADLITVHVPLTASTRNLLGTSQFEQMKTGVRIVNCARGGVIEEDALVQGLTSGKVAGAALDVFAQEPPTNRALLEAPNVVFTPHLGASTEEAQVAASVEVAQQIIAVLEGQPVRYAVNAPAILPESLAALGPYVALGERLGELMSQLTDQHLSRIEITYAGQIADLDVTAVKSAVVKGLLSSASPEHVNLVNALLLARTRGLQIVEARCSTPQENYANLISLRVPGRGGFIQELAGTVLNAEPHLVRVDQYRIDVVLSEGYLFFVHHVDQPGVVGRIGTLLGAGDVNISAMQVGRLQPRGEAMMVLAVDEPIDQSLYQRIISETPIQAARLVQL